MGEFAIHRHRNGGLPELVYEEVPKTSTYMVCGFESRVPHQSLIKGIRQDKMKYKKRISKETRQRWEYIKNIVFIFQKIE